MLKNKTILITGATAGFGRATALACVREGAKVIAIGRRAERLEELKKECASVFTSPVRGEVAERSEAGGGKSEHNTHPLPDPPPERGRGNLYTLPLDVRDNGAIVKAIASLPKEFADIDVLINNAGGALGMSSFEESSIMHAQQMIETNIMGVVYCTHAVLPGMVARGRGHIVNVSSTAGNYPYPGGNVYGGTKAFVTQFSLNLRADLLGKNIRVTNVEPGMAETEFSVVRFDGDQKKADAVYQGVKPLNAGDIAETILWAITRPAHVNINRIELMPLQQAFGPFAIDRKL